MDAHVESTIKGCLIKNPTGDLIATLEYHLQPINNTNPFKFKAFECISKLNFHGKKTVTNEEFFGDSCVELIKEICISQINHFKNYKYPNDIVISYNLPLSALIDNSFVKKMISESSKSLAIEITSFDIEKKTEMLILLIDNIKTLKSEGFQLWFDDFFHDDEHHSFWFSLIDWDLIKLDKSYLNIDNNFESIKKALDILGGLNLKIVVEGVERKCQYEFLSHQDVFIQGFIISKPKSCVNFGFLKEKTH